MVHPLRLSLAGILLAIPAGCSMLVSASSGIHPDDFHQSSESVDVVHEIQPIDASGKTTLELNDLQPGQHVQLVTTVSGDERPLREIVNEAGEPQVMELQRTTVIAGTIRSVDQQGLVLADVVTVSHRTMGVPTYRSKLPWFGRFYKGSAALSTSAVPGEVRLSRAAILQASEISDSDWVMYQRGSVTERIGVDFDFDIAAD